MAGAAARVLDDGICEKLEQRIRQIRRFAEDDYPENVRKELLVVVDDFHDFIPGALRAAASTKSGQYLSLLRTVNAGFGNRDDLAKMTFEMLNIGESILDAVKEEQTALSPKTPKQIDGGGGGTPAPERGGSEANVVTLLPPARPKPSDEKKPEVVVGPDPGKKPPEAATPVVVRAKDISKQFSSTRFELARLSFELKLGQITALVGRNGSGKSTLLKLVLGELASGTGSLEYPMLEEDGRGRGIKANTGYVAQRPPRWRGRLRENLEFIAAAYGIRGNANLERVTWLINRFALVDYEDHTWAELSGGYQLRFELARALVHRPYLLILDEPLANLDVVSQEEFLYDLKLIANSMASRAAILITSQHLFEMETIADQLILLREGQQTFLGDTTVLGEAREYNSIQLAIDASEQYLQTALSDLDIKSIRRYTTHYQVDFARATERTQVLAVLSNLPVPVKYFRDISYSSRPLMSNWLD
jgi:ABC-2 type transport system ATP-binding protein